MGLGHYKLYNLLLKVSNYILIILLILFLIFLCVVYVPIGLRKQTKEIVIRVVAASVGDVTRYLSNISI